ncbi:hypothetical protein TDB9533_02123 [Thalassocella blandensis]|nr:hypothetical protein TDB9533_02123 [Thalassocella blandensis]
MKRHYYLSSNLDDLAMLEQELMKSGFEEEQLHVLSNEPAGVESHHLHSVNSLSRQDLIHSGFIGLIAGVVLVALTIGITTAFGFHSSIGWAPTVIFSIVILGFCTWEGGLWGIQKTNHLFERFQQELSAGRHVFFVDVDSRNENKLQEIVNRHEQLESAGIGVATPGWVVGAQHQFNRFVHWAP